MNKYVKKTLDAIGLGITAGITLGITTIVSSEIVGAYKKIRERKK